MIFAPRSRPSSGPLAALIDYGARLSEATRRDLLSQVKDEADGAELPCDDARGGARSGGEQGLGRRARAVRPSGGGGRKADLTGSGRERKGSLGGQIVESCRSLQLVERRSALFGY